MKDPYDFDTHGAELTALLDMPASKEEVLDFLKRETPFIPRPFLIGHRLQASAMLLEMPIGHHSVADFAYVTKQTDRTEVILIKIGDPNARVFSDERTKSEPTLAFHAARSEVLDWITACDAHPNIAQELVNCFLNAEMQKNPITTRAVLVMGRRSECDTEARKQRLLQEEKNRFRLLTFDSLVSHAGHGTGNVRTHLLRKVKNGLVAERVLPDPILLMRFESSVLRLSEEQRTFFLQQGHDVRAWEAGHPCMLDWGMLRRVGSQDAIEASDEDSPQISAELLTALEKIATELLEGYGTPADGEVLEAKGIDLGRLPADLVESTGGNSPRFTLTLAGWQKTRHADSILSAADRTIEFLQSRLVENPHGHRKPFEWKDLREHVGDAEANPAVYICALDVLEISIRRRAGARGSMKENVSFSFVKPEEVALATFLEWEGSSSAIDRLHASNQRRADDEARALAHQKDRENAEAERQAMPSEEDPNTEASAASQGLGSPGMAPRTLGGKDAAMVKHEEAPDGTDESVFVVHGRDETRKEALFDFLRAIGVRPMSWNHAKSLGSGSRSNFEIIQTAIRAAQAVILLFTPDEVSELRGEFDRGNDRRLQPRPNVIFEAGWALGSYREKTIVVEAGMVHGISDIDGLNSERLTGPKSLHALSERLRDLNFEIDQSDPAWMQPDKYQALFDRVELNSESSGSAPKPGTPEALGDATLFELQKDKLPRTSGFCTYTQLDEASELPPGTAARFAVDAAKELGLYESDTEDGVRLKRRTKRRSAGRL